MKKLKIDGDKLVLMAAIVAVFVLFTALNRNFLSVTNLINILIAASLVGLVAIGHTYLIIAGQNDLSPGSLAAFSGVLAATLVGMGVYVHRDLCDHDSGRYGRRPMQRLHGQ